MEESRVQLTLRAFKEFQKFTVNFDDYHQAPLPDDIRTSLLSDRLKTLIEREVPEPLMEFSRMVSKTYPLLMQVLHYGSDIIDELAVLIQKIMKPDFDEKNRNYLLEEIMQIIPDLYRDFGKSLRLDFVMRSFDLQYMQKYPELFAHFVQTFIGCVRFCSEIIDFNMEWFLAQRDVLEGAYFKLLLNLPAFALKTAKVSYQRDELLQQPELFSLILIRAGGSFLSSYQEILNFFFDNNTNENKILLVCYLLNGQNIVDDVVIMMTQYLVSRKETQCLQYILLNKHNYNNSLCFQMFATLDKQTIMIAAVYFDELEQLFVERKLQFIQDIIFLLNVTQYIQNDCKHKLVELIDLVKQYLPNLQNQLEFIALSHVIIQTSQKDVVIETSAVTEANLDYVLYLLAYNIVKVDFHSFNPQHIVQNEIFDILLTDNPEHLMEQLYCTNAAHFAIGAQKFCSLEDISQIEQCQDVIVKNLVSRNNIRRVFALKLALKFYCNNASGSLIFQVLTCVLQLTFLENVINIDNVLLKLESLLVNNKYELQGQQQEIIITAIAGLLVSKYQNVQKFIGKILQLIQIREQVWINLLEYKEPLIYNMEDEQNCIVSIYEDDLVSAVKRMVDVEEKYMYIVNGNVSCFTQYYENILQKQQFIGFEKTLNCFKRFGSFGVSLLEMNNYIDIDSNALNNYFVQNILWDRSYTQSLKSVNLQSVIERNLNKDSPFIEFAVKSCGHFSSNKLIQFQNDNTTLSRITIFPLVIYKKTPLFGQIANLISDNCRLELLTLKGTAKNTLQDNIRSIYTEVELSMKAKSYSFEGVNIDGYRDNTIFLLNFVFRYIVYGRTGSIIKKVFTFIDTQYTEDEQSAFYLDLLQNYSKVGQQYDIDRQKLMQINLLSNIVNFISNINYISHFVTQYFNQLNCLPVFSYDIQTGLMNYFMRVFRQSEIDVGSEDTDLRIKQYTVNHKLLQIFLPQNYDLSNIIVKIIIKQDKNEKDNSKPLLKLLILNCKAFSEANQTCIQRVLMNNFYQLADSCFDQLDRSMIFDQTILDFQFHKLLLQQNCNIQAINYIAGKLADNNQILRKTEPEQLFRMLHIQDIQLSLIRLIKIQNYSSQRVEQYSLLTIENGVLPIFLFNSDNRYYELMTNFEHFLKSDFIENDLYFMLWSYYFKKQINNQRFLQITADHLNVQGKYSQKIFNQLLKSFALSSNPDLLTQEMSLNILCLIKIQQYGGDILQLSGITEQLFQKQHQGKVIIPLFSEAQNILQNSTILQQSPEQCQFTHQIFLNLIIFIINRNVKQVIASNQMTSLIRTIVQLSPVKIVLNLFESIHDYTQNQKIELCILLAIEEHKDYQHFYRKIQKLVFSQLFTGDNIKINKTQHLMYGRILSVIENNTYLIENYSYNLIGLLEKQTYDQRCLIYPIFENLVGLLGSHFAEFVCRQLHQKFSKDQVLQYYMVIYLSSRVLESATQVQMSNTIFYFSDQFDISFLSWLVDTLICQDLFDQAHYQLNDIIIQKFPEIKEEKVFSLIRIVFSQCKLNNVLKLYKLIFSKSIDRVIDVLRVSESICLGLTNNSNLNKLELMQIIEYLNSPDCFYCKLKQMISISTSVLQSGNILRKDSLLLDKQPDAMKQSSFGIVHKNEGYNDALCSYTTVQLIRILVNDTSTQIFNQEIQRTRKQSMTNQNFIDLNQTLQVDNATTVLCSISDYQDLFKYLDLGIYQNNDSVLIVVYNVVSQMIKKLINAQLKPCINNKFISQSVKHLYRTNNSKLARQLFDFINYIQIQSPDLLDKDALFNYFRAASLYCKNASNLLVAPYQVIRSFVVIQKYEIAEVYDLMRYFVNNSINSFNNQIDGKALQLAAESVGFFINTYKQCQEMRLQLITDSLKIVMEGQAGQQRLFSAFIILYSTKFMSGDLLLTVYDSILYPCIPVYWINSDRNDEIKQVICQILESLNQNQVIFPKLNIVTQDEGLFLQLTGLYCGVLKYKNTNQDFVNNCKNQVIKFETQVFNKITKSIFRLEIQTLVATQLNNKQYITQLFDMFALINLRQFDITVIQLFEQFCQDVEYDYNQLATIFNSWISSQSVKEWNIETIVKYLLLINPTNQLSLINLFRDGFHEKNYQEVVIQLVLQYLQQARVNEEYFINIAAPFIGLFNYLSSKQKYFKVCQQTLIDIKKICANSEVYQFLLEEGKLCFQQIQTI